MTRVEELTLRWLDGQADSAERDELAGLVEADQAARAVHLSLIAVEVSLRGRRTAPSVADAVMDRVGQERTDRAVRQVMRQVSSMTPLARGPRAAPARSWRAAAVALALASVAAAFFGMRAWPPATPPPVAETGRSGPTRPAVEGPSAVGRPLPDFGPVAELEAVAPPPTPDPSVPVEVLAYDFEDGELPEVFIDGHLAKDTCAPGSQYCALGTMSPFDGSRNTVTVERFKPPLLQFAPNQVLTFDYWVGADAPVIRVQAWVRSRKENHGVFLRDIVRERWGRAEIRLEDLRGYRGKRSLLPSDAINNLMITAGRMGGAPFYVDNLRVLAYPEDGNLPVTSGALSLSR